MQGNIYLITDGLFFKIGRTKKDCNKRLKELQTGSPYTLQLIESVHVNNASMVESILHRKYFYCKQINEWFSLEENDVSKFKENCLLIDKQLEITKNII